MDKQSKKHCITIFFLEIIFWIIIISFLFQSDITQDEEFEDIREQLNIVPIPDEKNVTDNSYHHNNIISNERNRVYIKNDPEEFKEIINANTIWTDNKIHSRNDTDTLIEITPQNHTVTPGSSFTISVFCTPSQPITSFIFSISYNTSFIQPNSVSEGDIFNAYSSFFNAGTINNSTGKILSVHGSILGSENTSNSGYLAHINFTAQQVIGNTSIILFNVNVTNESTYLSLKLVNGSVQIIELNNQYIVLSNELPIDNSSNISILHNNVSINITDPENQLINWTIQGTNIQPNGQNEDTNGIKTALINLPLPYNSTITWYVNATDTSTWTNKSYKFTTRDIFTAHSPINFSALAGSATHITLTWIQGKNADMTYIEWNSVPTWNQGERHTTTKHGAGTRPIRSIASYMLQQVK